MIIGKNLMPEVDTANITFDNCRFIRTAEFPVTNLNSESATKSVYLEQVRAGISFSLRTFGLTSDNIIAYRPHPLLGHDNPGGETVRLGYRSSAASRRLRLENSIDYLVTENTQALGSFLGISWFPGQATIWRIDDLMFIEQLEFEKKPNIGYTLRDIDLSRSQTNDFGVVNTIERNTIREIDLDFSLLTRSEVTTLRNFFLERKSKPFFLSVDDAEDTLDKVSLAGKFYIPDPKEINHLFKDYFSTSLTVREFV